MNYFKNFKIVIFSISVIIINIIVILLNIDSNTLDDSQAYLTIGETNDSIGGIGMSIDESEDLFTFDKKFKVDAVLKRYSSSDYNTYGLLNDNMTSKVIDVPYIYQTIKYPTGCESVSATSVLQYYGIDVSVDTFIDNYLPQAELKVIGYKGNNERILSSMHPNEYFIGNPKSYSGLGCYQDTIANAVNSLLKDYQLEEYFTVTAYDNLSIEDIQEYLENDVPVIVWATQNLVPSEKGLKWYLGDTNEVFQYMKNEHCMVAIGYDDDYIYFNDTLIGRVAYPKWLLEKRYLQMGSRSVIIEYVT